MPLLSRVLNLSVRFLRGNRRDIRFGQYVPHHDECVDQLCMDTQSEWGEW